MNTGAILVPLTFCAILQYLVPWAQASVVYPGFSGIGVISEITKFDIFYEKTG